MLSLHSKLEYRYGVEPLLKWGSMPLTIMPGQSVEHILIHQALLYLPTASRRRIRSHDTDKNHPLRDQAVGLHNPGLFQAKRHNPRLS